jgi:hypothetical protein
MLNIGVRAVAAFPSGPPPDALKKQESLTFERAAKRVHEHLKPTRRSERQGQIWLATIERCAFPFFGKHPLETVGTADVL